MRYMMIIFLSMVCWTSNRMQIADIKYINGYSRTDGTYVSGHWKDTSGDGIKYNNANYLGLND